MGKHEAKCPCPDCRHRTNDHDQHSKNTIGTTDKMRGTGSDTGRTRTTDPRRDRG